MLDAYLSIVTNPLFAAALLMVSVWLSGVSIRRLHVHKKPALNALGWFAIVLLPVWLTLLGLTLKSLYDLGFDPPPVPKTTSESILAGRVHYLAIVGLMTALAGLVGTPLALIRVFTTERTTKAAEEGLVTERINKAVAGLGTEKSVSKIGRPAVLWKGGPTEISVSGDPGNEPKLPDRSILRRTDRSSGLLAPVAIHYTQWPIEVSEIEWQGVELKKVPTDHVARTGDWQVFSYTEPNLEVRIGAIYALERIAQDSLRDHIQIMEILCAYVRENAAPERNSLRPRADIQVAIDVLGRRNEKEQIPHERKLGYKLDLRNSNLRGYDFSNRNFEWANFRMAYLENSDLQYAKLKGANFWKARMRQAKLQSARLDAADLRYAWINGMQLQGASLVGVDFGGAREINSTDFRPKSMRGAGFKHLDLRNAQLDATLHQTFGDGSVMLPTGLVAGKPPLEHWVSEDLDWPEFETRWRAWQREIGYTPPDR